MQNPASNAEIIARSDPPRVASPLPGKRRSTQAQRDQAATWREAGRSVLWIARRLGFSKGAVDSWFLEFGVEPPKLPQPTRHTTPEFARGQTVVRRFTAQEDERLLTLAIEGLGHAEIARRLTAADPTRTRCGGAIRGRLLTLARQESRREAMQHLGEH